MVVRAMQPFNGTPQGGVMREGIIHKGLGRAVFGLALLCCACVEEGELREQDFYEDCGEGECRDAEHIKYTCRTATMDSAGTWWIYEVPSFNNSSEQIGVIISKGGSSDVTASEPVGNVYLEKSGSQTWSDGNVTVRLGLKSADAGENYGAKSIEVSHANVGITAGLDNGFCDSEEVPHFDQGPPQHPEGSDLAAELNGVWRASDPSSASDIQFKLATAFDGTAAGLMIGRLKCKGDTGEGSATPSGASFPSSILDLYSLVMAGKAVVDTFNCASDPNGYVEGSTWVKVVPARSMLTYTPPQEFCPDGNRWGEVTSGEKHLGWLCIQNYGPTALSMYAYVPGKPASQWVSFQK